MPAENQTVKAVWKGTGKEPQHREYGYGTGRSIPSQVWAQLDNPESNWDFVYGDTSAQDANSNAKYMNTPVWFYEKDDEMFYTLSPNDIPDDATDAYAGHVFDAFKLAATKKETKSKPIAPKELQARRLQVLEALWVKMGNQGMGFTVSPQTNRVIFHKTDEPEKGSLLPLFLLALNTANSSLIVSLNKFAESSAKEITMSMYDLMGVSMGEEVRHLLNADPAPYIEEILTATSKAQVETALLKVSRDAHLPSAESDESLQWEPIKREAAEEIVQDLVAELIADEAETEYNSITGQEVPHVAERDVTPYVQHIDLPVVTRDVGEVAPFDPHALDTFNTNKVKREKPKPEIVQAQKEYSMRMPQLTSKGFTRGANFINSIPGEIMQAAYSGLHPEDKAALLLALPGVFKRGMQGKVTIAPSNMRDISAASFVTSAGQQKQLLEVIERFTARLGKLNPRMHVSADLEEYSPLFLDDLPFRTNMNGEQISRLVAQSQMAFRNSLMKVLKQKHSDTHGPMIEMMKEGRTVDLQALSPEMISDALIRMNRFAFEADDEGNVVHTEFGRILKEAADTMGIDESEAIGVIKDTFVNNMSLSLRSTGTSYNSKTAKTSLGLMIGMFLGMVRGSMRATAKPGNNSGTNGQMHLAHDQFDAFADELFGGRVFMSSDDILSYRTMEGRDLHISTSIWQAVHLALPYYMDAQDNLIFKLNGEEVNFTALQAEEKEPMRDAIMSYIANQTNVSKMSAFEGDEMQYFMIKKYQDALYKDEIVGEALKDYLGRERVNIKLLEGKDSVVHQPSLDTVQQTMNSLSNFLFSDIMTVMDDVNQFPVEYRNLPTRKDALRAYLKGRIDRMSLSSDRIMQELGVAPHNVDAAGEILTQSLDIFLDEFMHKTVEDMKGTQITKAGYAVEQFAMISPILAMMIDPRFKDTKFNFDKGADGKLAREIPPTDLIGGNSELPKTGYKFFDSEFTPQGYTFTIDGEKHGVFTDKNQNNGAGDIMHVGSYMGKKQLHTYESKLGKASTPEKPYISYVSKNFRAALLLGRGGDLHVGGYRTLSYKYDAGSAQSPLSTPPEKRGYGKPAINNYGLLTDGAAINPVKFVEHLSGQDGFGLSGVRSL